MSIHSHKSTSQNKQLKIEAKLMANLEDCNQYKYTMLSSREKKSLISHAKKNVACMKEVREIDLITIN